MSPSDEFDWSYAAGPRELLPVGDSQDSSHAEPGAGVGPYRIVRLLGRGGAGAVYEAQGPAGVVALKLLEAGGEDAQRRFLREAATACALEHPGIVRALDAGIAGDRAYIAYTLVEGACTLDRVMIDLDLPGRVAVLRAVAEALGHAHSLGVTHRDLKPANILVDPWGRPHVADFGLSLRRDLERLTVSGAWVGTPLYMAPEQLESARERQGPRTDVWALGVLLFEAVTGRLPFPAQRANELVGQVLGADAPRLRELVADVDPRLEDLCARSLARDPSRRPADGAAFAAELPDLGPMQTVAAPPPRSALQPGDRIGPFVIGEALGAGAFATVYRATHVELGREVALKRVSDVELRPRLRARLQREVEALARLAHPGVLTIHGLHVVDGVPLVELELVEGETLGERLSRGPLPWREASSLVARVARAVEHAHGLGVLHRDLKPDNVLLRADDGRPVVADFGLARLDDEVHSLTRSGDVIGTPSYLPPEAFAGRPFSAQGDVYALGVLLYRAVSGRSPFEGAGSLPLLAMRIAAGDAAPLATAEAPAALRRVISRAMALEPRDRYASAGELADALEAAQLEDRGARGWGRAVAFATLTVAVLGVAAWVARRPDSVAPETPAVDSRAPRTGLAADVARLEADEPLDPRAWRTLLAATEVQHPEHPELVAALDEALAGGPAGAPLHALRARCDLAQGAPLRLSDLPACAADPDAAQLLEQAIEVGTSPALGSPWATEQAREALRERLATLPEARGLLALALCAGGRPGDHDEAAALLVDTPVRRLLPLAQAFQVAADCRRACLEGLTPGTLDPAWGRRLLEALAPLRDAPLLEAAPAVVVGELLESMIADLRQGLLFNPLHRDVAAQLAPSFLLARTVLGPADRARTELVLAVCASRPEGLAGYTPPEAPALLGWAEALRVDDATLSGALLELALRQGLVGEPTQEALTSLRAVARDARARVAELPLGSDTLVIRTRHLLLLRSAQLEERFADCVDDQASRRAALEAALALRVEAFEFMGGYLSGFRIEADLPPLLDLAFELEALEVLERVAPSTPFALPLALELARRRGDPAAAARGAREALATGQGQVRALRAVLVGALRDLGDAAGAQATLDALRDSPPPEGTRLPYAWSFETLRGGAR